MDIKIRVEKQEKKLLQLTKRNRGSQGRVSEASGGTEGRRQKEAI